MSADTRRFAVAVVLLGLGAVGHLYVIASWTEVYAGLPLWIWVQLLVLFVLLGIARIAVGTLPTRPGGAT